MSGVKNAGGLVAHARPAEGVGGFRRCCYLSSTYSYAVVVAAVVVVTVVNVSYW